MANQIIFALPRVTDENGAVVSGALAEFFETGTTTAITVYSDEALTTAHATPLVADSGGLFAQVFYGGTTETKVVVSDADEVEIYTLDPAPMIVGSASAAQSISFAPVSGNNATNVQDALENVATSLDDKVDTSTTITGGGLVSGGGDLSANRVVTVTVASQAEAEAGSLNTVAMTPLRTSQAIAALQALTEEYHSSDLTITANVMGPYAHGFSGGSPDIVEVDAVCQSTEFGFSAGGVIFKVATGTAMASDIGVTAHGGTTNIFLNIGDTAFAQVIDTSGNRQTLTNANWKLRIHAWRR